MRYKISKLWAICRYLRCLKDVRIVRQVIVTPTVSRACVLINIPLLGSHDRKNTYNRAIIRPPHDIPDTTDRIAGDRPAGWPFRRTNYSYAACTVVQTEGGLDQPGARWRCHHSLPVVEISSRTLLAPIRSFYFV